MGDFLDKAEERLSGLLKKFASRKVRYSRKMASGEVDATVGKTEFEAFSPETGLVVHAETRDYLIQAADLVLNGERVLPEVGDRIREELAGKTIVCEVMAPQGQPQFRWCDPSRTTLRVHAKQVGTE